MSYALNTLVSKDEQNELKDMIFKRAQERADLLNKDLHESCTSNIKNELMNSARESFVAKRNPFSIQVKKQEENLEDFSAKENIIKETKERVENFKTQIYSGNQNINKAVAKETIISTMNDARGELEHKSTFMGALNFLNSQASISLISSRGSKFEALV